MSIASLRGGASVSKALACLGHELDGIDWATRITTAATHGHFKTGVLAPHPLRDIESKCARRHVLACLVALNTLQRHDGKIAVVGDKAFFGKTYRVRSPEEYEALCRQRVEDEARGMVFRWPVSRRAHVPAKSSHGFASRVGIGPRQLKRHFEMMCRAGLLKAYQPPRDAPDAVFPMHGSYPYPEIKILRALPAVVLGALRVWWKELVRYWAGRPRPVRTNPRPSSAPVLCPTTGPPPSSAGGGAANYDSITDMAAELDF